MNQFLYNISIFLMGFIFKFASIFNKKAKLWINGRKNVFEKIKSKIAETDKIIWTHVSSLGEYEQGLPVILKLKEKYPDYKYVISFFSPSGYEVMKDKTPADLVFYLPLDTPKNSKKIVEILHPEIVLFVKYDYWFNLLQQLCNKKHYTVFISAIVREQQVYFKSYGKWFLSIMRRVNHYFVQNEEVKKLLEKYKISQVTVSGDTRFDRVKMLPERNNDLLWLEKFKQDKTLIVAGSTWKEDDRIMRLLCNQTLSENEKMIIVPHNIDCNNITLLKNQIKLKTLLYSQIKDKKICDYQVLIIDAVGMLTKIFSYADIAFVGGGFGKEGVHNVLEPAVFGIPVIYGPIIDKFTEAVELQKFGGGIVIHSFTETETVVKELLNNPEKMKETGTKAKDYVFNKPNSTQTIIHELEIQQVLYN